MKGRTIALDHLNGVEAAALLVDGQVVAAARKYNRMVQHGTQNRSSPNNDLGDV